MNLLANNENLAHFCHNTKSYNKLSTEKKKVLDDLLQFTYEKDRFTPHKHKLDIWKVMMKNKVSMPYDFFETIGENDSIEMWSDDQNFLFVMGKIMDFTSYSIEDLISDRWENLFERDPAVIAQILTAFQMAMMTNTNQYNVTDWHIVKEVKSELKLCQTVRVKMIAPFSSNAYKGVFAIVESKPLSVYKKVQQVLSKAWHKTFPSFEN